MVAGREFVAAVFGLVAALALGLAAAGLYGVLAYTVSQRTREFGIRLALGASRRSVFGLVLRDGAVMVLAGVGMGAIFAMWVAKLLSVWLYTVHPTDAGTLVGAEAVLLSSPCARVWRPHCGRRGQRLATCCGRRRREPDFVRQARWAGHYRPLHLTCYLTTRRIRPGPVPCAERAVSVVPRVAVWRTVSVSACDG